VDLDVHERRAVHSGSVWAPGIKKTALKKNGRFGVAEAAKFREETPRKGGGFSDGSEIPRCNNMLDLPFGRKR
jgi:hypothetical protein